MELFEDGIFKFECDYSRIDGLVGYCGFFGLFTNVLVVCGVEAFLVYGWRDVLGKGFDDLENYLGVRWLCVYLSGVLGVSCFVVLLCWLWFVSCGVGWGFFEG